MRWRRQTITRADNRIKRKGQKTPSPRMVVDVEGTDADAGEAEEEVRTDVRETMENICEVTGTPAKTESTKIARQRGKRTQ